MTAGVTGSRPGDNANRAFLAVAENPFRVLGLPASATEREIQKQVRRLTRFAEVDRPAEVHLDLPALGVVDRSADAVQDAVAKIEHGEDRMLHALFWFVRGTEYDDIALDHLAQGGLDKALEIWMRVARSGEVSARSISARCNLVTLGLSGVGPRSSAEDGDGLANALRDHGALLTPDSLRLLQSLISIRTGRLDLDRVTHMWASTVARELSRNGNGHKSILLALEDCPTTLVQKLEHEFTQPPKSRLAALIDTTRQVRIDAPAECSEGARSLFLQSEEPLRRLSEILGDSSLKYRIIADEVGAEILDCAVAYFNALHETEHDPGPRAKQLVDMAAKRAVGSKLKNRIRENRRIVQEWIEGSEARSRERKVKSHADAIATALRVFQSRTAPMPDGLPDLSLLGRLEVKGLLDATIPHLEKAAAVLGASDPFYLRMSDTVAMVAMNAMVQTVNNAQAEAAIAPSVGAAVLRAAVDDVRKYLDRILTLQVSPRVLAVAIEHKRAVDSIAEAMSPRAARREPGSIRVIRESPCYVATMVYGDADHPDVRALRIFRDRWMLRSLAGRFLVGLYYEHSPAWCERWKNAKRIHRVVRRCLRVIVRVLPQ